MGRLDTMSLLKALSSKPHPAKIETNKRLEIGNTNPDFMAEVKVAMGVILTLSSQRGKWQPIPMAELFAFCRDWGINLIDFHIGFNVMVEAEEVFVRKVGELGNCVIPSAQLAGMLNVIALRKQVFTTQQTPTE